MIQAAIFDMDGLLIDSEPFWKEAEKAVFASVGIQLTDALCEETVGLRIDGIVQHWFDRRPWPNKTREAVQRELAEGVADLIEQRGAPLPGALDTIAFLRERGLPLALCTSSPRRLIEATLKKLQLHAVLQVTHSADDEPFGKPHPAAYLTVARRLAVPATSCLVFEDSLTGAIAGKAARMKVVAVPSSQPHKFSFCDAQLESLQQFSAALFEQLGGRLT